MHLATLTAALLLPFLAMADSTTTSTSTMTKTITVLQVVATETMTYHNATSSYASVGTASSYYTSGAVVGTGAASTASSTTIPANYMGAASSLDSRHIGGAALVAMAIAAIL